MYGDLTVVLPVAASAGGGKTKSEKPQYRNIRLYRNEEDGRAMCYVAAKRKGDSIRYERELR